MQEASTFSLIVILYSVYVNGKFYLTQNYFIKLY
nr:MAG TPA: hypothetical protein [Caudoviricetes sp.]DAP04043.1 MAG TPA: hypothetical protein [Caudoviricetes sp.]